MQFSHCILIKYVQLARKGYTLGLHYVSLRILCKTGWQLNLQYAIVPVGLSRSAACPASLRASSAAA